MSILYALQGAMNVNESKEPSDRASSERRAS